MQERLGFQPGADAIPVNSGNFIQPSFDIENKETRIARSTSRTTTTTGSPIYTTPADKDFFLTYINCAFTKDAANDNVIVSISAPMDGVNRAIIGIPTQTLTAGSYNQIITFPYPIKIDRSAAISLVMVFTVGTMSCYAVIGGYVLE